MLKTKLDFECTRCEYTTPKWLGRCPQCSEWNTFEEQKCKKVKEDKREGRAANNPQRLSEISVDKSIKYFTQINELDRVLGHGLTKASITLLGGEPGVGKSTILLEMCKRLSTNYQQHKILYISGEETNSQIAQRCKRIGIDVDNLLLLNESSWQQIQKIVDKEKPEFLIVDSIQTISSNAINGHPGSPSQIKEVTNELVNYCKGNELTCIVVGHITKDGAIAGPKLLEHMVDTVLYFEGDQTGQYRVLRAHKNRFGSTNESGFFEMLKTGINEVDNPSKYFLDHRSVDNFGRSISSIVHGSRPLFFEAQALVVENKFSSAKRICHGLDTSRLGLLVAIIDKYFEVPISYYDIYINIIGGIKLESRDSDLAIIASLVSSYKKRSIKSGVVFVGEVGLSGEVRAVKQIETIINEASRLGINKIVTGSSNKVIHNSTVVEIICVDNAKDIESYLFE